MGNCCGGEEDVVRSNPRRKPHAFEGQGHRLGTGDEARLTAAAAAPKREKYSDNLPEPVYNPNLTNDDREAARRRQLEAAEARMKAQQPKTKKKKGSSSGEPLRGPNSEPLMKWNL